MSTPATQPHAAPATGHPAGPVDGSVPGAAPPGHSIAMSTPAKEGGRHWWLWLVGVAALAAGAVVATPWVIETLNTVSTDDAYVNSHVTFVAARVSGQVARVLVDDNNRVHKGDLLVQLDKEPFQVQVNIAQAAVDAAQADLVAARARRAPSRDKPAACDSVLSTRSKTSTTGSPCFVRRSPRWNRNGRRSRRLRPTMTAICRWCDRAP